MKKKIFGNVVCAVRGVKNWLGAGGAKALATTAALMFARRRSLSVIQASIILVLTACGVHNARAAIKLSESNRSDTDYVEYSHLGSRTRTYNVSVPNGKTAHVVIERTKYEGQNEDRSKNRFYIYKDNASQSWTGMTYETDVTADTAFAIKCKTEAYYHVEIIYNKKTGLPIGYKNVYWKAYYCRYHYTISVTYKGGGGGGNGSTSSNSNYARVSFVSDGHVVTSKQYKASHNYFYSSGAEFPKPAKPDCKFLGWRLSDTDERVVVRTDEVAPHDYSLYALWARNADVKQVSGFSFGVKSSMGTKALWTLQDDGSYCSRGSSCVDNGESTWMKASVYVPAGGGYLSFEYKDSASNYDKLIVSDGDTVLGTIYGYDRYGNYGWDKKIFFLNEGMHSIQWTYSRNTYRIASGSNCFWVRSICLAQPYRSKVNESNPSSATNPTSASAVKSTTYTIKFNANGGTGDMSIQKFKKGVAQKLTVNTFKRFGYIFAGWAKSPDGAVVYTDGQSVSVSANMTLYAKWGEIIAGRPDTSFATAQAANGALYRGDSLVGTVQVKIGKVSKKNTVKISASATMLVDGRTKKVMASPVTVDVAAMRAVIPFRAPIGDMTFEKAADGTFTLKSASYLMAESTVGGALDGGRKFVLGNFDLAVSGELLKDLLPYEVTFDAAGGRWQFAKAAGVKVARGASEVAIWKETNGKKKLNKYAINVIGFVVNGKGYGEASCRRPAGGPWPVTVE